MTPEGSVVLITGRGRRAAVAELAAARGNNVAVNFRSNLKAAELVAEPRSRR